MEAKVFIKWAIIIAITAILSFLHMQGGSILFETHLLHQQLFFIPIILASFWFRLRVGLIVAVIISAIFVSSMVHHMTSPSIELTVYLQIALYLFVAALIGWLTGKLEKQQQQAIKAEKWRSVTQLASALSLEIQDVVRSLETRYRDDGDEPGRNDRDEIEKLKRLTGAFEQLGPPDAEEIISEDINELVKKIQRDLQTTAKDVDVALVTELDEAGCPSMVINETIARLIKALAVNAIEASPANSKVILRTTRTGLNCVLEVVDFGHGVSQEHIPHLFEPFFTTKPGGHGLTLAAGKKVMKDYEGDLLYEPGKEGGSIFKLVIPRENVGRNIDEHISERMPH